MYAALDSEINERLGCDLGFEALIRATAAEMDGEAMAGFRARYAVIKTFQEECLALFKASLSGQFDRKLATMALGDVPGAFGTSYHRVLTDLQHRTPVFFRTDEVAPGKLSEIQCCGSGWDLVDLLRRVYADNPDVFGHQKHFGDSLAAGFAQALRRYLGAEPVVHHLIDNASRPHGVRYFVQRTREQGVRYFSYDRGVGPNDCNFLRSHDFVSVVNHNFYADRMQRCNRRELYFDLPPSALFDGKLILAWPFWSLTRAHFGDEIRDLFPYTVPITPGGIELEGGEHITIDEFCDLGPSSRNYYIKYAGTDIAVNWGSRAVFLASSLSGVRLRSLMTSIVGDWARGRHWIIQPAIRSKERIATLARDGEAVESDAYSKWSGFYGPDGLMAILVFHRRFHKVHGSEDTVMSIVY